MQSFYSKIKFHGLALIFSSIGLGFSTYANADFANDLSQLSLEELGNIQVTSASKTTEPLHQAASPLFVISREDILRSGARTVPEMLRLAPNLQVVQTGSANYVVSARGFTGNPQAQSFSNKLLVLIDGRSVYSPLFSGVYWDMQDVLPEDIDRIEVISGPGATLWGANAVNGVINIITRDARATQNGVVTAAAGNIHRSAAARYGDENENAAYRAYAKGNRYEFSKLADGDSAGDGWSRRQGGFRIDAVQNTQRLTLQGDIYRVNEQQLSPGNLVAKGGNILGRWQNKFKDSGELQLQTYFDHVQRDNTGDSSGFTQKTYDIELQHNFPSIGMHRIVWGAGYRATHYDITPSAALLFDPTTRTLDLFNAFIEDTVQFAPQWRFIAGVKTEKATGADSALMPSARLAWDFNSASTVWASASKAVRSSTPFDRDVIELQGTTVALIGDKNFDNESVVSYQLGLRMQPTADTSFSITLFDNRYDNLRTIEFTPSGLLTWGNRMEGRTRGAEVWGTYQVVPAWRLSLGWSNLDKDLRFDNDSSQLTGLAQAGNDASNQWLLRSALNITNTVTFDTTVRGIHELPDPAVPGYVELSARLGWAASNRFSLALVGNNLLRDDHLEFTTPSSTWIRRELFVEASWKFE